MHCLYPRFSGSTDLGNAAWRSMRSCTQLLCVSFFLGFAASGDAQPKPDEQLAQAPPRVHQLSPELRGDIDMARKRYLDAIDAYRQAPRSALIENKIGIAYQQLVSLRVAKEHYQAAIKLKPSYAEAINNLGTVFYEERSYGKAIKFYSRSLKFSNLSAYVYVNLATAYFAHTNYKKASENFQRALELDPNVLESRGGTGPSVEERDVSVHADLFDFYLAKAYAKAGNNKLALQYLRRAMEEGLTDRKNLPATPEFANLRHEPAFQELLAENPKPL